MQTDVRVMPETLRYIKALKKLVKEEFAGTRVRHQTSDVTGIEWVEFSNSDAEEHTRFLKAAKELKS